MAKTWVVFAAACVFFSSSFAEGLPIPPPDLASCGPVRRRTGSGPDLVLDCCLPTDVPVKDFVFPDPSEPIKIRKNAVSLDPESIEKLNKAYMKMRALPDHDPRSKTMQEKLHCGYCNHAFYQQNSTRKLDVHSSWLVLPFHRWYVYFHERILAKLIDDPTLAIPYWNWDNQSSIHHPPPNSIPKWAYTNPGLNDEKRDPDHYPPKISNLQWGPVSGPVFGGEVRPGTTDDQLRIINNALLHETIVRAVLPGLFLGGIYRFDEDLPYRSSPFELGPHASIHTWVGDPNMNGGEDMALAYSSARDPLFFNHHSNVDRLFRDWHALGGSRRAFPTDPDWLNASFLFFDENGDMVRVTVAQSLDIDKLRYTFEPTENSWLVDPTIPLSTPESSTPGMRYWAGKTVSSLFSQLRLPGSNALTSLLVDIPDVESVSAPRFSASVFRSRVTRPHAALPASGKLDHLEEVLVIDRIWVPSRKPIWFEIFINLPEADERTPLNATEWCGRFTNGPDLFRAERMEREAVFSIGVGEKLKKLGIAHQSSLVVSLVPKGPHKHMREVQIRTIKIELQ